MFINLVWMRRVAQNTGGIARHNCVCWNILSYDAAGAHDCVFTDRYVAQNDAAAADRCALLYQGLLRRPILVGLELPACVRCPRIAIVDEDDLVSYKDSIFYSDAFTNKGVAGYLAVRANDGSFLNFNECADFRTAADRAAVQIDEVVDLDALAKLHVVAYALADTIVLSTTFHS